MPSDDCNDSVLLPNGFDNLVLPKSLVSFFDEFEIDYKTIASFPMGVLRSLYKRDFKRFHNIVYFLSLYGCEFHSAKNNSFFPSDVNSAEDILAFSGSPDESFSVSDMNKYGIWDFCTNADSSKCCLLNGVVVSRLKNTSENAAAKLTDNPSFSIVNKNLYGQNPENEIETSVLPKDDLEACGSSSTETRKGNGSVIESENLIENDDSNDSSTEFQDIRNVESELSFSNEFFGKRDSDSNEESEPPLASNPVDSATGVCSPRFWIRFVSSFFSMDKKAKEVYANAGYKTFGDLVEFKLGDIKKIVDGLTERLCDSYLVGIYEDELICFCKKRDSFLGMVDNSHSLREFLTPSDFTLECIRNHPGSFYYFNKAESPFLFLPLEESCQKLAQIGCFAASYLRKFGVLNLDFIGDKILEHPIDAYQLLAQDEYLDYFLHPFNVIDSLCCSLMGKAPADPFSADHEVYSLWIPGFIQNFYDRLGKYGNESHKKHREILNLRETTDITLEELGQRYNVTRERIRQIEAQIAKALSKPAETLMDSLFEIQRFLPVCFAKRIPGLYSCTKNKASKYYADDELGIILRKSSKTIIEKAKNTVSDSDYLQDCGHLDDFYLKNGFGFYGWLNKISYHLQYNPYPQYIASKISLKEIGKEYLISKGPAGYDVNKDEDELMQYYQANAPYMKIVSYRAISSDVLRSGVILRGMSVYVSPAFITEEQINAVKRILDEENFGHYGFTGLSLYEKHKDELLTVGIDNGYFLYGIASVYASDGFQFGGRSLRISCNGKKSLSDMVEHYIFEKGPIVKVDDLLRDLHLKNPALQQISNLTKYDSNTLVLKPWFKWTKAEFEELIPFIDEKISLQGFCHAYDIIGSHIYFDDSRNAFLQENRIGNNPSRLIYFLDAMAERYHISKYHFSHHCDCISAFDKPVETKQDMAMSNFKGKTFTKKEIESFFQKFHLTGNISSSDFYSGWAYFVDNDTLILKSDLLITNEIIKGASDILNEYYGDEIFITALTAINRLRYSGYARQFGDKAMEMASVLSDSELSNWCIPENDIAITSAYFRGLLINKKATNGRKKYSDLIRLYVEKSHSGSFLSLSDIQKELKDQELIDNHVNIQILGSIFSKWFYGSIVEVPNEP